MADVPRGTCVEHGVRQIAVPWAESGSRFTALFERVVIDWLKEASASAVSRRLRLTWDEVDGIMARAVARGLGRRDAVQPTRIGIDETSYQKRHEYVTVVTDLDQSRVLDVADGRKQDCLDTFLGGLSQSQRDAIEVVALDMWQPYIKAVGRHLPQAQIAFDKFHVAKHLGDAVDTVRKQEHRELRAAGDETLTRTKYLWLQNPENMSDERWSKLRPLRSSTLRTARAWAMKETAMQLWSYVRPNWARRAWKAWLGWASRCRLKPMVRVGQMIRKHLDGIINAVVLSTTNAMSESMNSKIQRIKARACGYRNRARFRNAILFHLGGLDLYPRQLSTHTIP
jgi:transposase